MSILNNEQILKYYGKKEIIIEPFNLKNLKTTSYDVRLGENYFREQKLNTMIIQNDINYGIYNMYSKKMVEKVWGEPIKALPYSFYKEQGLELENVKDDEKIIMINPGESILTHTEEFIGAASGRFTTMLHTRSSVARNFIMMHFSAGMGDAYFCNKWCLEVKNLSSQYKIPLIVGRRVAQVVFIKIKNVKIHTGYHLNGKYQLDEPIEKLMLNWSPHDITPKKYLDYEIIEN